MLLIDDGDIELEVKSKDTDFLYCEATNSGAIKNRKKFPGVSIKLPSNGELIRYAIENKMVYRAFICS